MLMPPSSKIIRVITTIQSDHDAIQILLYGPFLRSRLPTVLYYNIIEAQMRSLLFYCNHQRRNYTWCVYSQESNKRGPHAVQEKRRISAKSRVPGSACVLS